MSKGDPVHWPAKPPRQGVNSPFGVPHCPGLVLRMEGCSGMVLREGAAAAAAGAVVGGVSPDVFIVVGWCERRVVYCCLSLVTCNVFELCSACKHCWHLRSLGWYRRECQCTRERKESRRRNLKTKEQTCTSQFAIFRGSE